MTAEIMEKMRTMKPKAGMTVKQQEEWIAEHQKLMEQVMGQMMEEHHLLMMDKKWAGRAPSQRQFCTQLRARALSRARIPQVLHMTTAVICARQP